MGNRIKLNGTTSNAFTIGLNGVTLNATNIGPYTLNFPANVGTNNQYLRTDGTGNLSWATISTSTPGGSNTQIQFNDAGSFGGSANFTFNKTTNVLNINGNVSNVTLLDFNSTITSSVTEGQLAWDTTEQTLNLGMTGGVTQQIGQEIYYIIQAQEAITNGRVVAFAGVVGGTILAKHANTSDAGFESQYVMGVATQDIAINEKGYITAFGKVNDIDTSSYSNGAILWLSPNTEGLMTTTAPSAPNPKVIIAACLLASTPPATNGRLLVRPTWEPKIDNLENVTIATPTTGQTLVYTGNIWQNQLVNTLGTLSNLSVSGNANVGNLGTAGLITAAGNIQGGNLRTTGLLSVGGNANVGNIGATNGVFTNISGNGAGLTNLPDINQIKNANSNVSIPVANGNILIYRNNTIAGQITESSLYLGLSAGASSPGSNSIAIGTSAGSTFQGNFSVAIGYRAGSNSQNGQSIAIGPDAGFNQQNDNSVAIGFRAGNNLQANQAVAIGALAATQNQGRFSVAIGSAAGDSDQGLNATALGFGAASNSQGNYSVAVGSSAANNQQGIYSVAVGTDAGRNLQGNNSVAIGYLAGNNTQGKESVAVGWEAGNILQGNNAVAFGAQAGKSNQGAGAVAVGYLSGETTQGINSIAIGDRAGKTTQGQQATAVGDRAGEINQGINAVAIGLAAGRTSQAANSIVINATGANLENTVDGSFVVKPIRQTTSGNVLFYNQSTGEISYEATGNITSLGTLSSLSVSGNTNISNLNLSGNLRRITGLFSDLPYSNRVLFQTTTANRATALGLIPSSNTSQLTTGYVAWANTDPDNGAYATFGINEDIIFVGGGTTGVGATPKPLAIATADLPRITIDTSGRATNPYQPAFWAYGNTTATLTFSGAAVAQKVPLAFTYTNRGSYYNTTTSRFTVPVAGMYVFYLTTAVSVAATTPQGPGLLLYKNGAVLNEVAINYSTEAFVQFCGTAIVEAAVNDYFEMYVINYNNSAFTLAVGRSRFGGYLYS
jgi:hypothetical protein